VIIISDISPDDLEHFLDSVKLGTALGQGCRYSGEILQPMANDHYSLTPAP